MGSWYTEILSFSARQVVNAWRFLVLSVLSLCRFVGTLLRLSVWTPIAIALSTVAQLLTLPVNLPMKLFLGTTMQALVSRKNIWASRYVLLTFFQYATVILAFGMVLGLLSGAAIATLHVFVVIPDVYLNIPIEFWKLPGALWSSRLKLSQSSNEITEDSISDTSIPLSTKSDPPLSQATFNDFMGGGEWKRHSISSKEHALRLAAALPSDFFQETATTPRRTKSCEDGRDAYKDFYHTPVHSPRDKSINGDSEVLESNIWDRYDELPTTLRSQGGGTTMSNRRPFISRNYKERVDLKELRHRK